ncbi:uncharacterized protein LOC116005557 [Ipomoea triloba]|uniref:uncharacterized protein LOC116005557 n=1 Tax=Ipomoea triloba TaxID=35885 RepID=UPI00125E0A26|nr:uncharacterized protein LOC116005557 [Ipomoea triloba]
MRGKCIRNFISKGRSKRCLSRNPLTSALRISFSTSLKRRSRKETSSLAATVALTDEGVKVAEEEAMKVERLERRLPNLFRVGETSVDGCSMIVVTLESYTEQKLNNGWG